MAVSDSLWERESWTSAVVKKKHVEQEYFDFLFSELRIYFNSGDCRKTDQDCVDEFRFVYVEFD